jgi:hypothetical protein
LLDPFAWPATRGHRRAPIGTSVNEGLKRAGAEYADKSVTIRPAVPVAELGNHRANTGFNDNP